MTITELFKLPWVDLPKNRVDDRPLNEYLHESFEQYIAAIDSLEENDPVSLEIKAARVVVRHLTAGIENAVSAYLNGFPHRAYGHLRNALQKVRAPLISSHIWADSSPLSVLELWIEPYRPGNPNKFYRIRLGKMAAFKRKDLFHVPYELRHLVKSQRYSISGLPCLYLGGSLWTCWEELGRPDFHEMQLSRFCNLDGLKVLDFGFRPSTAADPSLSALLSPKLMGSYVICWPLIAACSICVFRPDAPFIPEYIVPQLLLQWLRNETEMDGLRYFSTKISGQTHSPWAAMNYVFPVREQVATGFCPNLQSKFSLTAPVAWSILTTTSFRELLPPMSNSMISINEDTPAWYVNTEFSLCERKLDCLDSLPLGSTSPVSKAPV